LAAHQVTEFGVEGVAYQVRDVGRGKSDEVARAHLDALVAHLDHCAAGENVEPFFLDHVRVERERLIAWPEPGDAHANALETSGAREIGSFETRMRIETLLVRHALARDFGRAHNPGRLWIHGADHTSCRAEIAAQTAASDFQLRLPRFCKLTMS